MKDVVLSDFYEMCIAQNYISQGGILYAKEILERAIGSAKAMALIDKLTSTLQVRPLTLLEKRIQTNFKLNSK